MTACNDGTAKYCCGQSNTTCCGTRDAISIQPQESICTANDPNSDIGREGGDKIRDEGVITGLAIALGFTFLVGVFSTLWLWKRNIALKHQLAEKAGLPLQESTPAFEAQCLPSDQIERVAAYQTLHGRVQSTTCVISPESEVYESAQRYSELDSSASLTKNALSSASPDETKHI